MVCNMPFLALKSMGQPACLNNSQKRTITKMIRHMLEVMKYDTPRIHLLLVGVIQTCIT